MAWNKLGLMAERQCGHLEKGLAVLEKPWLQTRRKETLPGNKAQTEPDPFLLDQLKVLEKSVEREEQSKLNALRLGRDVQR